METKAAFVVYGVHKDGLQDPTGTPFIEEAIIEKSKNALKERGLSLVEHETVLSTRKEAAECLTSLKKRDDIDALILFPGTWVWGAHLIAAIRDFSRSDKAIVLWNHPGTRSWRPVVGGLVVQGGLKEIGINHRYVYGSDDEDDIVEQVVSYCRASAVKNVLNMEVMGALGGRGMGQTCGAADPSQWMRKFGIDIDSRGTIELLETAKAVTKKEIENARSAIEPLFSVPIPQNAVADRSISLYIALKKLMEKNGWGMYTIQSFPGLGDYYSATCFAQSMMLNDGYGTSTLCDFNTAMCSKLINELSEDPPYYGDMQHVGKSNNEIKIIGDGACPPALAGSVGPAKFAEHGIPTEGEAGGLSVDLVCKPGEGILARLGRTKGEFEMILARCSVSEPEASELQTRRDECGIPFWPHAFTRVHCDIDDLLQAWNNEYAVLGYGAHLYEEIKAFCEQTEIKVVVL